MHGSVSLPQWLQQWNSTPIKLVDHSSFRGPTVANGPFGTSYRNRGSKWSRRGSKWDLAVGVSASAA
jgi:hypothetical protein